MAFTRLRAPARTQNRTNSGDVLLLAPEIGPLCRACTAGSRPSLELGALDVQLRVADTSLAQLGHVGLRIGLYRADCPAALLNGGNPFLAPRLLRTLNTPCWPTFVRADSGEFEESYHATKLNWRNCN